MQIVSLKLLNFRNYDHLELTFSTNNNLIYGKNGMGKTNLVEAIYVLALTKSFRGSVDKVLIKTDKNLTKISGIVKDNVRNEYQIIISNDGKNAKVNGNKVLKLSDYISKINVILFNPDDLRIIKDTPSVRRKCLNVDISEINNDYLKLLNQYNKILKQRNAYLKTMYLNSNTSKDYLNVLTMKLIELGQSIYLKRNDFLTKINIKIKNIFNKICGISTIEIEYISSFKEKNIDQLKKLYSDSFSKDSLFGKTLIGIHHDDYLFKVNGQNLKDYGSEGQQKNAIIAYKLAEIEIIKEIRNTFPILILDDLFSELDNEKIKNILNLIDDNIQTFITTTEIDLVDNKIKEKSKCFFINDDNIMEENYERNGS